jgi:hypothetical protein
LAGCSGAEEESATTNAVSRASVVVVMVVLDVFKSLVTSSAFAALVLTESLAFLLPILFGFVLSALLKEDEHDERATAIIFVVVL